MSKRRIKFDFGKEPRVTILHSTCFYIIAMHYNVAIAFRSEEEVRKKGDPRDLF